ncbi:MAG TPA: hypothetical protein VEZ19_08965 [Rubrobacter sp.]|nr:hypothetical protein [Rubrobacter sp.]
MPPPTSPTTTVAILGADTLAEDILAKLLREAGYSTRLLEAHPAGLVDQWLDGADVLLLTPGLDDDVRRSFLEATRSIPETASVPLILLPAALEEALLDELAVEVSWRQELDRLVREIEVALGRAGGSAVPPAEVV